MSTIQDIVTSNVKEIFTVDQSVPFLDLFPWRPLVFALLGMAIADMLIVRKSPARYFILHAGINAAVVYMTAHEVRDILFNPQLSLAGPPNRDAMMVVYSVHIYHMLFFKIKDPTEIIHHLVSVFVVGTVSNVFNFGLLLGGVSFFMCGLPGGIDYALLALVKHKIIDPMTEKRINSKLNLYIRAPGIFICSYSALLSYYNGHRPVHFIWILFTLCLDNFNGFYYAERVVGNFHVQKHVRKEAKKAKSN